MSNEFNVRALGPHEWWNFREVRLESLKLHPENYGAKYEVEAALGDQVWIARLVDSKSKIFGLLHKGTLIGLNGVFTYDHDPEEKTALMAMWYLKEEYRGKGLFANLVQTGVNWAERQERFHQIRVHHRDGNVASEANIKKAGFVLLEREAWTWPDGQTVDLCQYVKKFER